MGVMTTDQAGTAAAGVASTAHVLPADEVARSLGVDTAIGLPASEVARRAAASGPNELEEAPRTSIARLFWDALTEPFVVLLIVAGVLAVVLGEVRDGLLVLLALLPIVGRRCRHRVPRRAGARGAPRRVGTRGTGPARRAVDDVPAAELVRATSSCSTSVTSSRPTCASSGPIASLLDRSVLTGESVPEPAGVVPEPRTRRSPIGGPWPTRDERRRRARRGHRRRDRCGDRARADRRGAGDARAAPVAAPARARPARPDPARRRHRADRDRDRARLRSRGHAARRRTCWPGSRRRSPQSPRSRRSCSRSSSASGRTGCSAVASWSGGSTPRRRSARST